LINHYDVAQKIAEIIRALPVYGTQGVNVVDFPFSIEPPHGLIVSPLKEREYDSTNETNDVGFPCQVMRVGHRLSSQDGFKSRSAWRRELYKRFRRTRIGVVDTATTNRDCELFTVATFDDIELPKEWEKWNLDASVLVVTTVVRGIDNP
jgi:hypothetical protein